MRTKLSLIPALVVAAMAGMYVGCSSTTEPSNNEPGSTVSFTQNAKFTYVEQRRDTAGGTYGNDQVDPTSTDTVHSTVIDTNASIYGKTHVVVIYNQRSRNPNDTTYIWQDGSGNLYRYNYGADIINNVPAVVAFVGHRLEVGWVLQSKMAASSGSGWIAGLDSESVTLPIVGLKELYIKDTATYVGDTSITVSGSSTSTRHTRHVVTASLDLTGSGVLTPVSSVTIDNYESVTLGEVENTTHSFTATVPGFINAKISGQERFMVSKQ